MIYCCRVLAIFLNKDVEKLFQQLILLWCRLTGKSAGRSLSMNSMEMRRLNMDPDCFYGKKDLDPQLHGQEEERKVAVPECLL